MKIQMRRADFVKMVGKLQGVVPAKPSTPILANVLIEAIEENQLIISATDGQISMRVCEQAEVQETGAVCLPAKRLFQLIRELTSSEIEIETPSIEVAIIHAGSSNFRIQGVLHSSFPTFPDLSETRPITLRAESLKEMLTRTAFAAARDDSRQVLNGVLMERVGRLATFVGTDGKRLAKNQVAIEDDSSDSSCHIFPLKSVEEIIKMLDDKDELVQLMVMEGKLAIEAGSSLLITKLLSGQYPDVSRVIPKQSDRPLNLHREELMALLRQVALFTSEANHAVRFTFDSGALHLCAASGEIGEGKVSMPVNYVGPALEIAFNPYNFIDILRHSKDETIQLEVSDSYTPGRITDSSEAEFVLMPMRLA